MPAPNLLVYIIQQCSQRLYNNREGKKREGEGMRETLRGMDGVERQREREGRGIG